MIAIPAVDLRDGACVQLVGGSYDHERVRVDDPLSAARNWLSAGFTRLHVVDLDAALDRGSNTAVVERIVRGAPGCVQVGGGVRTTHDVERLLGWGAASVIVGTRALADPAWIAEQAYRFPGRIIAATDVRGGRLTSRGWTEALEHDLATTLGQLSELPLAGVLLTAVDVEGTMRGPALDLIAYAASRCTLPLTASGGIASEADLRNLDERGAAGAVIGMALYTGAMDARVIAREFGA
jgi:phosphoribosylformimino-5-aminoimidazole carboxamide ribotide isomerase